MALDEDTLDIPFSAAMQDHVDERLVPSEQLLLASDMVYRKDGRLSQRYGWGELGDISTKTSEVKSLVTYGDDNLATVTADAGVVAWREGLSSWETTTGEAPPTEVSRFTSAQHAYRTISTDVAYVNGFVCMVWQVEDITVGGSSPSLLFGAVYDEDGNTQLAPFELPSAMKGAPRVVGFNNTFLIFALDTEKNTFSDLAAGGGLEVASITATAAGLAAPGSSTSLTDFADGPRAYDVHAPDPQVDACYIVTFEDPSSANTLRLGRINSSLTVDDLDSVTQDIQVFLTLFYSTQNSRVYVMYADEGGGSPYDVEVRSKPVGSGSLSAPTTVSAGGTSDAATGGQATIVARDSAEDDLLLVWPSDPGGTAGHSLIEMDKDGSTLNTIEQGYSGYALSGKGKFVSGIGAVYPICPLNLYMWTDGDAQYAHQTLVTPRNTSHTSYVSLARYQYGKATAPTEGPLSSLAEVSDGSLVVSHPVLETFTDAVGTGFSENMVTYTEATKIGFGAEPLGFPDELNGTAVIPGGLPTSFDGQHVSPSGWSFAPIMVQTEDNTAGYKVKVVYRYRDALGNVHRSPVSLAKYPNSSDEIKLLQPFEDLTKGSEMQAIAYIYKSDTSETEFYFHHKVTLDRGNGTSTQTETVASAAADTAQAQPYTDGGVLSADPAPPMNKVISAAGRLWGIDAEDPRGVYYTKKGETDTAPEWNEALRLHLPEERVKGLGFMDDKVVLFTRDNIYVTAGEGPSRAGQGDFPQPSKVQGVGLRDPESVVSGPFGIMFRAEEGVFLLTRGLEVQFIGGPVEDRLENSNGTKLTVNSAVLLPDREEVRMLLRNAGGVSTDSAVVYNYKYGRWTVFRNHDGLDAVEWDNTYVHLNDANEVRYEVEDQYYDGTTSATSGRIIPVVDTAWIRVGSIQGLQRVKEAYTTGRTKTDYPPDLSVGVYYDYETSAHKTKQYDGRTTSGDGDIYPVLKGNFFELEWGLPRQKCSAIRFRFFWVPTGSWEGGEESPHPTFLDLISLSLRVAGKRGMQIHGTDHRGATASS